MNALLFNFMTYLRNLNWKAVCWYFFYFFSCFLLIHYQNMKYSSYFLYWFHCLSSVSLINRTIDKMQIFTDSQILECNLTSELSGFLLFLCDYDRFYKLYLHCDKISRSFPPFTKEYCLILEIWSRYIGW